MNLFFSTTLSHLVSNVRHFIDIVQMNESQLTDLTIICQTCLFVCQQTPPTPSGIEQSALVQ